MGQEKQKMTKKELLHELESLISRAEYLATELANEDSLPHNTSYAEAIQDANDNINSIENDARSAQESIDDAITSLATKKPDVSTALGELDTARRELDDVLRNCDTIEVDTPNNHAGDSLHLRDLRWIWSDMRKALKQLA